MYYQTQYKSNPGDDCNIRAFIRCVQILENDREIMLYFAAHFQVVIKLLADLITVVF